MDVGKQIGVAIQRARVFKTDQGCHVRHTVEFNPRTGRMDEWVELWTDSAVYDLRKAERARRARGVQ